MILQKPKFIAPGDTIGVCAPSGSFEPDALRKGIRTIESMGFNLFFPPGLNRQKRYLAGEDRHRASILNRLFSDPMVDAVICARGGFGALRLLSMIDYDLIEKNPKIFLGFSDITALLLTIRAKSSVRVMHGPVLTSLAESCEDTLNSLYQHLTGNAPDVLCIDQGTILRAGTVKGDLIGGNLTTISHMAGTPFQPNFSHSIFFLEEIAEEPYRIDRMLTQLKMAGMLEGVKGVVAGDFINCGSIHMIYDILLEIFDDENVPIMAGLGAGHGKTNFVLPFSSEVELDTHTASLRWYG